MYINDLVDGLSSYTKLYVDISLFFVIRDSVTTASEVNSDHARIKVGSRSNFF